MIPLLRHFRLIYLPRRSLIILSFGLLHPHPTLTILSGFFTLARPPASSSKVSSLSSSTTLARPPSLAHARPPDTPASASSVSSLSSSTSSVRVACACAVLSDGDVAVLSDGDVDSFISFSLFFFFPVASLMWWWMSCQSYVVKFV